MLPRSHAETFRQGVSAVALDVALVTGEWGFSLADARCPVVLWHGSADASTPPHMAEYLAAALPSARLRLLPGEGHFLLFPGEREILAGQ
jgi:pimeloyl-ACP methyl ester carboxylesterase